MTQSLLLGLELRCLVELLSLQSLPRAKTLCLEQRLEVCLTCRKSCGLIKLCCLQRTGLIDVVLLLRLLERLLRTCGLNATKLLLKIPHPFRTD